MVGGGASAAARVIAMLARLRPLALPIARLPQPVVFLKGFALAGCGKKIAIDSYGM
jgi:hypothetical protein